MKTLRILGVGAIMVMIAAAAVIAWFAFGPGPMSFASGPRTTLAAYQAEAPTGVPTSLRSPSLVGKGQYLTQAADCAACHTTKGGEPFAGGRAFKLPFGTLYSPNITPDVATGIGKYTDADFLKAVHRGIARDGKRLYPAFPYAAYSMLSDEDVLAIKAYLFSLKPVSATPPPNTLAFPFNQRWLMAIWGLLFNPDKRFEPVTGQTPQWNRGAYLVEAAGHCGDCHTPRNLMQAVDNRHKFAGGNADGWNAYNISGDRLTGIGAWTPQEIAHYLAYGHAGGRGTANGPMAEVVEKSLSHLTPEDIAAMAAYLKSVPPIHSVSLPDTLAAAAPSRHDAGYNLNPRGKQIFEGSCASCHAWNGSGALSDRAQLTGSRAVNDPSAANVAQMVLEGTGHAAGGRPFMPGFAAAYTDTEIASVANYVTARFGSAPSHVTREQVAKMRLQR